MVKVYVDESRDQVKFFPAFPHTPVIADTETGKNANVVTIIADASTQDRKILK